MDQQSSAQQQQYNYRNVSGPGAIRPVETAVTVMARAEHILAELRGAGQDAATILQRLGVPVNSHDQAQNTPLLPGLAGLILETTTETVRLRELLTAIQNALG